MTAAPSGYNICITLSKVKSHMNIRLNSGDEVDETLFSAHDVTSGQQARLPEKDLHKTDFIIT